MKSSIRFIYLMVLIAVLGLALLGVLTTSHHNTEVILQRHAELAMTYSAEAIADNTLRYLSPAERAAELTEELLVHKTLSLNEPEALEIYFMNQLKANAELASVYIGRPNGDFFFVKREEQGFFIKEIHSGPERKVIYRNYGPNLELTQETLNPEDMYDPRTRPWYQKAVQNNVPIWTDPYIFFTSKRPGVTVARPVYVDGEFLGVVSVDIEISGLSKFLATIPISKQGAAFIMNRDGLAIALPGLEAMISQDAEQPSLPQISTINNDRIKGLIGPNSAEQRLTHQQKTFRQFDLEGETQYGVLSSFAVGDEFWVIGVYAPAVDFQGQIKAQFYRYRLQIVGIWALVGLLAIPLVFRITRPMMRIYEQATRDELTQLPNRVEFLRRAKKLVLQAKRKKQEIAVAMMDLDGFKGINDTYGHKAGDEVLTIVGQRLASVVRSADLVGRLGGDEFALILTGVGEKEAMQLVERIRKRIIEEPIYSDDEVYVVGATAGVAMNQWGENVLETLAKADQALLDAKTIGKNCTLAFSAQGVDTIIYNHARAS